MHRLHGRRACNYADAVGIFWETNFGLGGLPENAMLTVRDGSFGFEGSLNTFEVEERKERRWL